MDVGSLKASLQLEASQFQSEIVKSGQRLVALNEKVGQQNRSLEILKRELQATAARHGEESVAVAKKQLQLDRLNSSIGQNVAKMQAQKAELAALQAGLRRTVDGTSELREALDEAGQSGQRFNSIAAGIALGLTSQVTQAITGAASALVGLGKELVGEGLQRNTNMEQLRAQFVNLTGSAASAREEIAALKAFNTQSPFELPELAESARLLRTLTDNAIGGVDTLRQLSGAAVAISGPAKSASQAMQELSFWSARLRAAIDQGLPTGEALSNLSTLGVVSGATAAKIREMAEAGASSEDIWRVYTDGLSRFDGALQALQGSLPIVLSNISDAMGDLQQTATAGLFDKVSEGARELLDYLNANSEELTRFAEKLGDGLEEVGERALSIARDVDWHGVVRQLSDISDMAMSLTDEMERLARVTMDLAGNGDLADFASDVERSADKAADLLEAINKIAGPLRDLDLDLPTFAEIPTQVVGTVRDLAKALYEARDGTLNVYDVTGALTDNLGVADAAMKAFLHTNNALRDALGANAGVLGGFFERVERLELALYGADDAALRSRGSFGKVGEETQSLSEWLNTATKSVLDFAAGAEAAGRTLGDGLGQIQEGQIDKLKDLTSATKDFVSDTERLTERRTKAEAKHAADLEKIGQDILKVRADTSTKVEEREAQLYAKLGELARDHIKTLTDLQRDLSQAEQAARDERAAQEAENQAAIEKVRADGNKKIAESEADLAKLIKEYGEQQLADAQELKDELIKLEQDAAKERKEIEADVASEKKRYAREAYQIQRDLQVDLAQAEEGSAEKKKRIEEQLLEFRKKVRRDLLQLADATQGGDISVFLSPEDRAAYRELQGLLAEEDAALTQRRRKIEQDAQIEAKLAETKNREQLEALEQRLTTEKEKLEEEKQRLLDQFNQEQEANRLKHEAAKTDLEARIQAERDALALALAEQEARNAAELASVEFKNAAAVQSARDRIQQENDAYAEQRARLEADAQADIAAFRQQAAEREQELRAALARERAEWATTQAELRRDQLATEAEFARSLQEIGRRYDGATDAASRLAEMTRQLRDAAAGLPPDYLALLRDIQGGAAQAPAGSSLLIPPPPSNSVAAGLQQSLATPAPRFAQPAGGPSGGAGGQLRATPGEAPASLAAGGVTNININSVGYYPYERPASQADDTRARLLRSLRIRRY